MAVLRGHESQVQTQGDDIVHQLQNGSLRQLKAHVNVVFRDRAKKTRKCKRWQQKRYACCELLPHDRARKTWSANREPNRDRAYDNEKQLETVGHVLGGGAGTTRRHGPK